MNQAQKTFNIKQAIKYQKQYKHFVTGLGAFLFAYFIASVFAPVKISSAEESRVNVDINGGSYNLSVAASANVNLSVDTASVIGTLATASDTLTAIANVPNGYQLYLSMDNNHDHGNRLYLDGNTNSAFIEPNHDLDTGADISADDPATLAANTWGFAASAEDFASNKYAAVPLLGDGALIDQRDTSGTFTKDVYYGTNINTNMATGTYTGKILYTIIGEDIADNYDIPSISPEVGGYGTQVSITAALASGVQSVEDLGTITATIGDVSCENQEYTVSDSALTVSCEVPLLNTHGMEDVKLTIQKYNKTYLLEGGFNYRTIQDITNMQEMTGLICKSTPVGVKTSLIDTRGRGQSGNNENSAYGVIKAADGNCWMTENLDLYAKTLTAAESDFASGEYTLPASTTWTTAIVTEPKLRRSTKTGYDGQVSYNWCAAAALTTTCNVKGTLDQSICPKNWQLPALGNANTNKSFGQLMSVYGITTGKMMVPEGSVGYDLGFNQYYGYMSITSGVDHNAGTAGYFWTSTNTSNSSSPQFYYDSSSVTLTGTHGKGYGLSVRCVSRD